ncbi:glycosyltransferase [Verrucomicrobia bacterium]|nr:glycosyltransferase [Verrucomicrobiota bacterium]
MFTFFLRDFDGGGAERSIVGIANQIAKSGYRVEIVVGQADSDYQMEVSNLVNVINFNTRSIFVLFFKFLSYLRACKSKAIVSALDIANITNVVCCKLSPFNGKSIVSQRAVTAASLDELGSIRKFITKKLLQFTFRNCDLIISNSYSAADDLVKHWFINPKQVVTINNYVDLENIIRLSNHPIPSEWADKIGSSFILSVGSLTQRKNMQMLIKGFSRIEKETDSNLVILGKGPENQNLCDLIQKLKLSNRIFLVGFDINPYKWIKASSLFVSCSFAEGFPNVIVEAMCLNKRIIATDCPGDTSYILKDGQVGDLISVNDTSGLVDALRSNLKNNHKINNLQYLMEYSVERITSKYTTVLTN